jgi:hypothetical protein
MKRMTQQLFGLGLAVVLGSTAAWAGERGSGYVVINTLSQYAYGSIGGARNSPDSTQFLYLSVWSNGTTEAVIVVAQDAAGLTMSCYSYEPLMVAAARTVTSDAYISFSWTSSGQCTGLDVRAASITPPKAP